MARKKSSPNKKGARFYTDGKKLRPILVYVPDEVHDALKRWAVSEDRSLQKTVKRILIRAIESREKER